MMTDESLTEHAQVAELTEVEIEEVGGGRGDIRSF